MSFVLGDTPRRDADKGTGYGIGAILALDGRVGDHFRLECKDSSGASSMASTPLSLRNTGLQVEVTPAIFLMLILNR